MAWLSWAKCLKIWQRYSILIRNYTVHIGPRALGLSYLEKINETLKETLTKLVLKTSKELSPAQDLMYYRGHTPFGMKFRKLPLTLPKFWDIIFSSPCKFYRKLTSLLAGLGIFPYPTSEPDHQETCFLGRGHQPCHPHHPRCYQTP